MKILVGKRQQPGMIYAGFGKGVCGFTWLILKGSWMYVHPNIRIVGMFVLLFIEAVTGTMSKLRWMVS